MKEQPIFSEAPSGQEFQLANSVTGNAQAQFAPDGSQDILRALGVFGGELVEKGLFGGAEFSEDLRKSGVGYSDAAYKFVQESDPELAKRLAGPKEELDAFLETNPRAWDTLATSINMGLVTGGNPFGFAAGAGLGFFREELTGLQEGVEGGLKTGMKNQTLGNIAEGAGIGLGYLANAGGAVGKGVEYLAAKGLGPKTIAGLLGGGIGAATAGGRVAEADTPLEALGAVGTQSAVGAVALPAVIGGAGVLAKGAKLATKVAESGFAKASEIVTRMTEGISQIKQKGAIVQEKTAAAEAAAAQRMQAQAMEAQFRAIEEATARQQQDTFVQERVRETQAGELRPTFQWMDNVGMSGQKQQAQAVADGITTKLLEAPNAETIFKDKAINEVQDLVDTLVSDQFAKTVEKSAKRQQFSRLMQRNMQEVRTATRVGELEQRMESLQAQYQKVTNTLNPNLNTPVTDFQKQAADEILDLKSQLDEVIQSTNEGGDLPDIPVVREMQAKQLELQQQIADELVAKIDDEIDVTAKALQDENAKLEGQTFKSERAEAQANKKRIGLEKKLRKLDSQRKEALGDVGAEKLESEIQKVESELDAIREEYRKVPKAKRAQIKAESGYDELQSRLNKLRETQLSRLGDQPQVAVDGNDVQAVLRKQITAKEQRLSNVRKMQVTKRAKKMQVKGEVEDLITQAQELQNEMETVRGEYLEELQRGTELAYQATRKQVDAYKKMDNIPLSETKQYHESGDLTQTATIRAETGDIGISMKVSDDSNKLVDDTAMDDEIAEVFGKEDLFEIDGKKVGLDGDEVTVKTDAGGNVKEIDIKKPTKAQKQKQAEYENPKSDMERTVVGTYTTREGRTAIFKGLPLQSIGREIERLTNPITRIVEKIGAKGIVGKLNKVVTNAQTMQVRSEMLAAGLNKALGTRFKSIDHVFKYLDNAFANQRELDFANATYEELGMDDQTIAIVEFLNKALSDMANFEVNGTALRDVVEWTENIQNYLPRNVGDYEAYLGATSKDSKAYDKLMSEIRQAMESGADPSKVVKDFKERTSGIVSPDLKQYYTKLGETYKHKFRQMMEMQSRLEFFEGKLGKDAPPISDTLSRFIEREAPGANQTEKAKAFEAMYDFFGSKLSNPDAVTKVLNAVSKSTQAFPLSGFSTMSLQLISAPRLAAAFGFKSFMKSISTAFDRHFRAEGIFEMAKDMEDLPKVKGWFSLFRRGYELTSRAPVAAAGGFEASLARGAGFDNFVREAKKWKAGKNFSRESWMDRLKVQYGENETLRLLNKFGDPNYKLDTSIFDMDVAHVSITEATSLGGMVFSKLNVAPALAREPQNVQDVFMRNMSMFTSFVAKNSEAFKRLVVDEAKKGGELFLEGKMGSGGKAIFNSVAAFSSFYLMRNLWETYARYSMEKMGAAFSANVAGADEEVAVRNVSTQENFNSLLFDQFVSSVSPTAAIMNLRRSYRSTTEAFEGELRGVYEAFWSSFMGKGSIMVGETLTDTAGALMKADNPFDPTLNASAKNLPTRWLGEINYGLIDPMMKGQAYQKGFDQERRFEAQMQRTDLAKDLKEVDKIDRMIEAGVPPELIMNDMSKAEALYKKLSDKSYMEMIQENL